MLKHKSSVFLFIFFITITAARIICPESMLNKLPEGCVYLKYTDNHGCNQYERFCVCTPNPCAEDEVCVPAKNCSLRHTDCVHYECKTFVCPEPMLEKLAKGCFYVRFMNGDGCVEYTSICPCRRNTCSDEEICTPTLRKCPNSEAQCVEHECKPKTDQEDSTFFF